MPQFDLLSFLSQIFWILMFFNIFFDILDAYFLPLIFQTLKIRTARTKLFVTKTNSIKYVDFFTETYINFIKNTYFTNFK